MPKDVFTQISLNIKDKSKNKAWNLKHYKNINGMIHELQYNILCIFK